jgi:hypothetical protein
MAKEYLVVSVPDYIAFQEAVNSLFSRAEGWELQGGVSVTYDSSVNRIFFAQAFVREIHGEETTFTNNAS